MTRDATSTLVAAIRLSQAGREDEALDAIERLLDASRLSAEERREALGFKAMILQDHRRLDEALDVLQTNLRSIPEGELYGRYATMIAIADVHSDAGRPAESAQWCRQALHTAVAAECAFGEWAVSFFGSHCWAAQTPEDERLIHAILVHRWRAVGLTGEPDVENPLLSTKAIREAANRRQAERESEGP